MRQAREACSLIVVSMNFASRLLLFVAGVAAHNKERSDAELFQESSIFQGSKIDILFLKSENQDNPGFRKAISAITEGSTSFFNAYEADGDTPMLSFLLQFHCVMVHTQSRFKDPSVLGDLLADYVDSGGILVFGDGFTGGGFTDNRGVDGRILEVGYIPIAIVGAALENGSDYVGDGTTLLYESITSFSSTFNNRDGDVSLQGDGIQDGTYEDGIMAAAYRPDFRVVYLNGAYCWGDKYPDSVVCQGGDHPRRWVNACSVANATVPLDPTTKPSPTPSPGGAVGTNPEKGQNATDDSNKVEEASKSKSKKNKGKVKKNKGKAKKKSQVSGKSANSKVRA